MADSRAGRASAVELRHNKGVPFDYTFFQDIEDAQSELLVDVSIEIEY